MNIKEFSQHFGTQEHYYFQNYWLIYFLIDESGEIVYVGKSSNSGLGKRLLHHKKTKDFETYFTKIGPSTEQEAYQLEGAFITLLRPKYNKANICISADEIATLHRWMTGEMKAYTIEEPERDQSEDKTEWTYNQAVSAFGIYTLISGLSFLFIIRTAIGRYDFSQIPVQVVFFLCLPIGFYSFVKMMRYSVLTYKLNPRNKN